MSSEQRGQCPDHQIDTNGSDSYCWNDSKGVGSCLSCGLATWTDDKGRLWGRKTKGSKPYLIEGEDHLKAPSSKQGDAFSNTFNEEYEVLDNTEQEGSYIAMRGITKDTMEMFGVITYGDTQEYTYPTGGIKVRKLPKDFHAKNGFKGDELFGMNLFPAGCSKVLTVCEGELDVLSAWQMLKNGSFVNPVVGLPSASPSGKLWEKCGKYFNSFDKIVVSSDNDEPGQKVIEVLFDLFPGKVYVMDHGQHKDANDFLQAGDGKAFKSAWWAAKRFSPAGFTSSAEDWCKALDDENPYEYVTTPIEAFNKVGRGLVKGGLTVLKAPPGSGKSSMLRMLQHDQVVNKGQKVAVLMMEEVKSITGRAMASYELQKNVMTREDADRAGVSEEEVKEALIKVVGDERFVSFEVNPQDPINDTLTKCNQAIAFYGVDFIYIDHLQRLAYLAGTDGATANLTELGVKLTELAKRKNVGIVPISHVNMDGSTKYAKSIEEEAIVLIELSRDREAEDMEERNTAYLTITKNRPFGTTGSAGALTYNSETTILTEKEGVKEPTVSRKDDF